MAKKDPSDPRPPSDPQSPPVLKVDAGTLVLIITALLLIPLLVTGFIAQ